MESLRKRPTLLLSSLLIACQCALGGDLPTGEWAISNAQGEVTGALEFKPDGTLTSKVDDSKGQYFKLEDGRTLLVISDVVMIGTLAQLEKEYAFQGSLYASSQPIALQLTESSPAKLKKAKESHKTTTRLIADSRAKQIDQLVLQNLAALASAFQLHMLIEGKQEAQFSDVVGQGKFLQALNSYNGERYENLSVQADTRILSVTDAEAIEHSYKF